MRALLGITLAAAALSACGGDEDAKPWPDIAPGMRLDRTMIPKDEQKMIQIGIDALDELPREVAEQIVDYYFWSDYAGACRALHSAATVLDDNPLSEARTLILAVLGESVRWDADDELKAECADDVSHAVKAL